MIAFASSPTLDPVAAAPAPATDLAELQPTLLHLARLLSEAPDELAAIRAARLSVAILLGRSPQTPARGPLTAALIAAAEALLAHPAAAQPVSAATVAAADDFRAAGWSGDLARLFAAPAWQLSTLRPLADQPAWLWATYARYLFAPPAFFTTTEQEARWAAHLLTHLEPLARRFELNRGSSALRSAARIASELADAWPLIGDDDQLRRRQQALARLRALLAPRLPAFSAPAAARSAAPAADAIRPSRPLRLAIVGQADTEGGDAAADIFAGDLLKSLLDPERFELSHHVTRWPHHSLPPEHVRFLPETLAEQVETLRAGAYDFAIFLGDLTRADSPAAAIARHRVAPHQFATASCPLSTGAAEIDFFLADPSFSPSAHSERLVLLPAARSHAPRDPDESGETPPARADFGLPDDARLLLATAHPAHTTVAVRAAWRSLLDGDSLARLVLLPGTSGPALRLLLAELEKTFADRVIVAGDSPLDTTALTTLLRMGDVYLPAPSGHDRDTSTLAVELGLAVPDAPRRADHLAYADNLAATLETIATAAATAGHHPAGRAPLCLPEVETDTPSRHRHGWDLLTAGRPDRAVVYLLAAAEDPQADAAVWHDLALALHANHQTTEAIQALETCVRIAPDRLDSWLQLAELATAYGHEELVHDITYIVREIAPEDPRVAALIDRRAAL